MIRSPPAPLQTEHKRGLWNPDSPFAETFAMIPAPKPLRARSSWATACGLCLGLGLGLGLGMAPLPGAAQSLEVTSLYEWQTRSVTGVSGLEISPDGGQFTALSDQGWVFFGQLQRTQGALTGIALERYLPLLGIDGLPSAARRLNDWSDAEGLAVDAAGHMWVSFERWTRVEHYAAPTDTGRDLPSHESFATLPENRQLEALALHPDGTLYTMAERAGDTGFALYRFAQGRWEINGHIPNTGFYAIVGADFDAAGRLFVLERRHLLGTLWQSRIRLVPDITQPEETRVLWSSRLGQYDNFEGIALWGAPGALRVTVVADNNGSGAEITQFLEFALRE